MNNLPRQVLRQIIAKHGVEICANAVRCENLLKDLCGTYLREINVLVNAIEERIPRDLLAAPRSMPLELLLKRYEKRLEEQTALTAEAASWAVESWALALNIATESEIRTRQNRVETVASPVSKTDEIQSDDGNSHAVPEDNRRQPILPPLSSPTAATHGVPPLKPSSISPQTASQVVFPTINQTINAPSAQLPATNQPAVKKSFGLFRGCLIFVLLLAIGSVTLFFGVPYAIEKMRETQRERNSEPPRFPVR